jgi:hypothetical protein
MKCKDCTVDCPYRTSDGEKECEFQNHILQAPDEWKHVRIQAAIAAMQGTLTILSSSDRYAFRDIVVEGFSGDKKTYPNEIAEFAVACADALIEELKKK